MIMLNSKFSRRVISFFLAILAICILNAVVVLGSVERPTFEHGEAGMWIETSVVGNTLTLEVHLGGAGFTRSNAVTNFDVQFDDARLVPSANRVVTAGWLDDEWGAFVWDDFIYVNLVPLGANAPLGVVATFYFDVIGGVDAANPLFFTIGDAYLVGGVGLPGDNTTIPWAKLAPWMSTQYPPADEGGTDNPVVTSITRTGPAITIGSGATAASATFAIAGSDLDKLTPADFTTSFNNEIGFNNALTTVTLNAEGTVATVNVTGGTANPGPGTRTSTLTLAWGTVEGTAVITQNEPIAGDAIVVTQAPEIEVDSPATLVFNTTNPIGATAFRIAVPANFDVTAIGAPAGWNVAAWASGPTVPGVGPGFGTLVAPGLSGPVTIYVEMGSDVNHTAGTMFTLTVTPTAGAEVGAAGPRNSIFHPFVVTFIDRFDYASTATWTGNDLELLAVSVTGEQVTGLNNEVPGWVAIHGGVEVIDAPRVLMGDVNRDGRLSSADIAILARAISDNTWAQATAGTPGFWSRQHANIGCTPAGAIVVTDPLNPLALASRPNPNAATNLGQWLVGIGGWMCQAPTTCRNITNASTTTPDTVSGAPAGFAGFVTSGCDPANANAAPDIFVPIPGFVYLF